MYCPSFGSDRKNEKSFIPLTQNRVLSTHGVVKCSNGFYQSIKLPNMDWDCFFIVILCLSHLVDLKNSAKIENYDVRE